MAAAVCRAANALELTREQRTLFARLVEEELTPLEAGAGVRGG